MKSFLLPETCDRLGIPYKTANHFFTQEYANADLSTWEVKTGRSRVLSHYMAVKIGLLWYFFLKEGTGQRAEQATMTALKVVPEILTAKPPKGAEVHHWLIIINNDLAVGYEFMDAITGGTFPIEVSPDKAVFDQNGRRIYIQKGDLLPDAASTTSLKYEYRFTNVTALFNSIVKKLGLTRDDFEPAGFVELLKGEK